MVVPLGLLLVETAAMAKHSPLAVGRVGGWMAMAGVGGMLVGVTVEFRIFGGLVGNQRWRRARLADLPAQPPALTHRARPSSASTMPPPGWRGVGRLALLVGRAPPRVGARRGWWAVNSWWRTRSSSGSAGWGSASCPCPAGRVDREVELFSGDAARARARGGSPGLPVARPIDKARYRYTISAIMRWTRRCRSTLTSAMTTTSTLSTITSANTGSASTTSSWLRTRSFLAERAIGSTPTVGGSAADLS